MAIRISCLINSLALAITFSLVPILTIAFESGRENFGVEFIFILIILQSAFYIFLYGGLLFKAYSTFSYFFFGIAPFYQFKRSITIWGGTAFSDEIYFTVSAVILTLNFAFLFAYRYAFKGRTFQSKGVFFSSLNLNGYKSFHYILVCQIICILVILYINNFSFLSVFFRGGIYKETTETSTQTALILSSVFRGFAAFLCAFYLAFSSRNLFRKTVIVSMLLVAASPLGIARFMVATFYIPLLLIWFPWFRKKYNLSLALTFGLLIVFPFLNKFRSYDESSNFSRFGEFEFLVEGHFDSYQSFARAIQLEFITGGWQLLGPLLFFVPRSHWPNKPIGSGAEMANLANLSFSNISANWYAEGYVNFGLAGSLVFCLVLAWTCGRLDKLYLMSQNMVDIPFNLMYFGMCGYIFFVLRGDLMSSTSFGVGMFIGYLGAQFVAKNLSVSKPC